MFIGLGLPITKSAGMGTTMLELLTELGLTTSLALLLDAGDANSYSGTGQRWSDVSGGGVQYNRGTTNGADSTDPTFFSAGRSSYFSVDGGDYFTPVASTSFDDGWHKDGATFTIAAWVYRASQNDNDTIVANMNSSSTHVGCWFRLTSSNALEFQAFNGSGSDLLVNKSGVVSGSPMFVAISADEGANTRVMQINSSQTTSSFTYTSPSPNNPSVSLNVGATSAGAAAFPSGSRFYMIAAWNRALSDLELASFYSATSSRFGA